MRAIVLHNPSAGTGDIAAEDLLAALAAGGIEARYRSTEQRGFRDALAQPADLVLVDGGAGTVGACRSRLCRSAARTHRALARITADPLAIAGAGWRETDPRPLDVGTAAGPWGEQLFVEAVGVGALARGGGRDR